MGTLPAEEVERNATTSTFLVVLPLLLILATLACGALSEAEKRYNAGVELQGQVGSGSGSGERQVGDNPGE